MLSKALSSTDQDLAQVWSRCLQAIRPHVAPGEFEQVFLSITPLRLEGSTLLIQVPTMWFYERLEADDFNPLLQAALTEVIGSDRELLYSVGMGTAVSAQGAHHITLPSEPKAARQTQYVNLQPMTYGDQPMNPVAIPGIRQIAIDPHLNPVNSLENFVHGKCNDVAYRAAVNIGTGARTQFNPLYLYGDSGLGKTHLSQSIGIAIRERHADRYVLYVSAKKFMREYTDSVDRDRRGHGSSVKEFINKYSSLHVLIIDDVHELSNKTGTQNVLYNIFNELINRNCQIVFTSLYKLVDMTGFSRELMSRFKSGLHAELLPPDRETRLKILKRRRFRDGIDSMPDEVLELIADQVRTNVRELEGVYVSVFATTLGGGMVSLDRAREVIADAVKSEARPLTLARIEAEVCKYFHVTPEQLASKARRRDITLPRQLVMYLARELIGTSYKAIGQHLGDRTHATVLHGCNQIEGLQRVDAQIRGHVEALRDLIVGEQ